MSIKHDLEIVPGVTAVASDTVIFAFSHQREKGEVQVQMEVYSNKNRRTAYKAARDSLPGLDVDRQAKREAVGQVKYIAPPEPDLSGAATPAERRVIMQSHQAAAQAARADFDTARDAAEALAVAAQDTYDGAVQAQRDNVRSSTISILLNIPADTDLTLADLYTRVMATDQFAGSIAD